MRMLKSFLFLLVISSALAAVSALRVNHGKVVQDSNFKTATGTAPNLATQATSTFFNTIVSALTTAPTGYSPIVDPQTQFIQFSLVGQPINPAVSFNDTQGFINPTLNLDQANTFAALVNSNNEHITNIQQAYTAIVESANAVQDANPANSASWKDAFWFLYVNQSNFNRFTNVTTYTIVPSETYAYYQSCLSTYNSALTAYRTAQTSLPSLQWYIAQPGLMGELQVASDNLQSVAPVIEDALTALNSLGTSLSATTISQARQMLSPLVGSDTALNLVPNGFYPVFPQPPDWGTNTGDYTNIAISNSNVQTTLSSSYSSWSAGGGFGGGFFSWGASWSASGGSSSQHYNVETTTLSVTASYALVELQRPWLLDSLFTIGGWSLTGYASGTVSKGTAAGITTGFLPCYPTHMIVAQNVTITGHWTANDWATFNSWSSGGGSIGFGPFAISGGRYSESSTSSSFSASVSGNTISAPGMQIIGWVQNIVPFSPQSSG